MLTARWFPVESPLGYGTSGLCGKFPASLLLPLSCTKNTRVIKSLYMVASRHSRLNTLLSGMGIATCHQRAARALRHYNIPVLRIL
jgi:hypothetical protein